MDLNYQQMKISEICRFLEEKAPLAYQEEFDNCGLLYGDPEMIFHKALLCLDLTPAVMEEAVSSQCNLVISHHPFIFKGIRKLNKGLPETAILQLAVLNNIAIYAIHTNLDNIREGLNAHLFKKLGIKNYRILSPRQGLIKKLVTFCPLDHAESVRNALFAAGAGSIGNYDNCSYNVEGSGTFRASENAHPFVGEIDTLHFEKEVRIEVVIQSFQEKAVVDALLSIHPYEEVAYDIYPLANSFPGAGSGLFGRLDHEFTENQFLEHLRKTFQLPLIRHTALMQKQVSTIALCTGSGSFLINEALRAGADIYITADLKYHDFFVPPGRILLADIGHYESEHWVKEWLYAALIEKFPNFAFLISEVNTNPVQYF